MTKGQEREGKLDSQITLRMPLEVHDRARIAAAYKRTSVNQVIVEVLDEHLPELPGGTRLLLPQEAPGAPAAVLDPGRAEHRPVGGTAGTVMMIDPEELVRMFEGAWEILKLEDVEREAQRSYLRYLAVRQDWKELRDFAGRIEEDCLEDEGVETWLTNEVEDKLLKLVGEEPEP